jgi:NitT/TauT family transport system ATP-binding protein
MTRRPATVVEDLEIPFERPRDGSIVDTPAFTEICSHLRGKIEHSHAHGMGRRAVAKPPAPVRKAS